MNIGFNKRKVTKTIEYKIDIDDLSFDVVQKNIKNMHLRIHLPTGKVSISAPLKVDLAAIKRFATSKLSWIQKQQSKFNNRPQQMLRQYITGEIHYFLGKQYNLIIVEGNFRPKVIIEHDSIIMKVKQGSLAEQREKQLYNWYRTQLKKLVPRFIKTWEPQMNVRVSEFGIKRMRTKWGTCNVVAKRIWLSLELARKPLECLEYVVVHEMVHLLERKHGDRFVSLMNKFLPQWRHYKEELNRK